MLKTLFVICLLIVCITACKKNTNNVPLQGAYTEVTPYEGFITLDFVSNKQVVMTEKGSASKDTFTYIITPGKIQLTPIHAYVATMNMNFEQTDANTIKMTSIGLGPLNPGLMTLKR